MKEYERHVFWLEYFDSERKRTQGRRVPLSTATRAPTLGELEEACRRLNIQPQIQRGQYPSAPQRESGYASVVKNKPKQALLLKIARELTHVRGMQQKKPSGPKKRDRPTKP